MMWDFGDQTYVPGERQQRPRSVNYAPQQSTYPPLAESATPFMPLAQPNAPSYQHSSSYSSSSSSPYQMSASAPPNPFSGAVTTRGPVEIDITYSHHSHHSHRRPSHSHQARPSSVSVQPSSSSAYQHHAAAPASHHRQPQAIHVAPIPHANYFQYSRCTGRKKALCVGINYYGLKEQLHGCINDAKNVANFLITHWGYKVEDIVLLSDDSNDPRRRPTRQNMIDAMHWLVKDAQAHDALFFHYSGHGSQVKDQDGDEIDGFDEVILPVDFRSKGVIIDDEMHDIMVTPLPTGCRLTAVFDSCHSGTALDLPYLYHSDGRLKGSRIHPKRQRDKMSSADVISFSACKDSQTSADTYENGIAVGAMSYALVKSLGNQHVQTYQELLQSIRRILRENYSQKPQLSSSHKIDTSLKFIL